MGAVLISRMSTRKWLKQCLAIFLILSMTGDQRGDAHELAEGVGTQTTFTIRDGQVIILFNLGWSVPAGFPLLADLDSDGDDRVEEEEWRPYLKTRIESLLPQLDLRINGQRVPLELDLIEHAGLEGSVRARPFDAYFTLHGPLPASLPQNSPWGGGYWLHWQDNSYREQTSSQYSWIPIEDHDPDLSFFILQPDPSLFEDQGAFIRTPGRNTILYFYSVATTFDPFTDTAPTAAQLASLLPTTQAPLSPEAEPSNRPPRPTGEALQSPRRFPSETDPSPEEVSEEEQIGGLVETIVLGKAPIWEVVLALLLAILYGAGHAIGPGHGKTMVAAYLVGTRGRIRDAVVLGDVLVMAGWPC